MRWLKHCGMLLLCCAWSQSCLAVTRLTHLRTHSTAAQTRFVFEFSQPVHFSVQSSPHPTTFSLHFPSTHLKANLSFPRQTTNPVTALHTKEGHGQLDVAFTLRYPSQHHIFTLNKNHQHPFRVVVDLVGHPKKTHLQRSAHRAATSDTSAKVARQPVVVVIDPGHGGKDPGATGIHGTHEKMITLQIGRRLYKLINQQPGFRAYLTRNSDRYITLRGRLAIARQHKANMFIAIHADAFSNHEAHGASVFALSNRGATSEAARWLAKRENDSELMGGVTLSSKDSILRSVLLSLSQSATTRASLAIGQQIIDSLSPFAHLHHRHVEQAAFVVLKSPDIPSLLVETGFLSNRLEEYRLRNPQYQQKLAKAMMQGIQRYFVKQPPRHSWLSWWRDHPASRPHK